MGKYLLQDVSEDDFLPLTIVYAENKLEALIKSIKGMIKDEILTIEDICDNLGISLSEFDSVVKTYE